MLFVFGDNHIDSHRKQLVVKLPLSFVSALYSTQLSQTLTNQITKLSPWRDFPPPRVLIGQLSGDITCLQRPDGYLRTRVYCIKLGVRVRAQSESLFVSVVRLHYTEKLALYCECGVTYVELFSAYC